MVADRFTVAVDPFAGLDRLAEPAEPVLAERDVPACRVDLPLVAGALEQPDRLVQLVDRLLETRSGVQDHAVEGERLALAPDVAEGASDLERSLGVRDATGVPRQRGRHRCVLGVGLRQLEGRWVPLEDVHLTKMRPRRGHLAAGEPVGVGESAVDAGGQEGCLGAGLLDATSRNQPARQQTVRGLDEYLPEHANDQRRRVGRRAASQRPQAGLQVVDRLDDIPAFERQLTETQQDVRSARSFAAQFEGSGEPFRCLVVPAAQHDDVAETLTDDQSGTPVRRLGSLLGDAVLLFGNGECVPGSGLRSGRQCVRERGGVVPGGVVVVGELIGPRRAAGLEMLGRSPVQPDPLVLRSWSEQRLRSLSWTNVHESPVGSSHRMCRRRAGTSAADAALPGKPASAAAASRSNCLPIIAPADNSASESGFSRLSRRARNVAASLDD